MFSYQVPLSHCSSRLSEFLYLTTFSHLFFLSQLLNIIHGKTLRGR
uniref:Uncharacterized protein n=1 Tax=Anopheles arabiensis TaxID=7173 RepID=A0A182IGF9_ANOAR